MYDIPWEEIASVPFIVSVSDGRVLHFFNQVDSNA